MATVKAEYTCGQNVLYSAIETLWERYSEDVAAFTNYKPSYTDATATAALAANEAAEEMPDATVQVAIAEEIGIDVLKLSEIVLDDYQKTKGYINGAFTKEYQHANYIQSGQNHYAKASNKDWESVLSLAKTNLEYITNSVKQPLLEADDNMPATFITSVTTNNANFVAKYKAYKIAMNTEVSTDAKITANNGSYNTTRKMLADAAIIGRTNPTLGARYIWDDIEASIDPKAEGLKGKAIDSVTSLPVIVTIIAKKQNKPAVTFKVDKSGKFSQILESGNYDLTVSAPNHKTQNINKDVLPHTMSRLNLSMVPN